MRRSVRGLTNGEENGHGGSLAGGWSEGCWIFCSSSRQAGFGSSNRYLAVSVEGRIEGIEDDRSGVSGARQQG